MDFPHLGHRDAGRTTDLPFGSRLIHTFKKLPITSPNRKTNAAMNCVGGTISLCHKPARASITRAKRVPDA